MPASDYKRHYQILEKTGTSYRDQCCLPDFWQVQGKLRQRDIALDPKFNFLGGENSIFDVSLSRKIDAFVVAA